MGSLAVLQMADHTGPSAPGGGRPVHPFFTAKRVAASDAPKEAEHKDTIAESQNILDSSFDGAAAAKQKQDSKPKKRGRPKKQAEPDADVPVEGAKEKPRPRKRTKATTGPNTVVPVNPFARANDEKDAGTSLDTKGATADTAGPAELAPEQPAAAAKPLSHTAPSTLNSDNAPKPKKVMKFNPKTGTIGSPPKPKPSTIKPDTETAEQASVSALDADKPSKLVRIQYGSDDASRTRIGEKVNEILNSPRKTKSPRTPRKKAAPRPNNSPRIKKSPAKATHPFFGGKGKLSKLSDSTVESVTGETQPPKPKRQTIQSSTPCSPKKIRTAPCKDNANAKPQFSVKSMGLKFPGSKPPAWPWKDMMHVRGDGADLPAELLAPPHSIPLRKSKGRAVQLSLQDSLMDLVTQRMDVPAHAEAVKNANSDDFLPPPPELCLPTKHFESGNKLQLRIFPQLKCPVKIPANSNMKGSKKRLEAADMVPDDHSIALHPPQLVRLFNQVRTSLSAFDRADCDNVSWAQKYAPTCAAEIIQPDREAFFLKEWLQALVVQSVDTGSGLAGEEKASKDKDGKTTPKKKSRKRKKLDDFIVSSDEEGGLLEEVSDNEHDWTPSGKFGIVKKTVMRAGSKQKVRRLANALVISGPHGCGKTAAVYAVAKELDFEVFEINSSSRRSGKDVDDKIGDMLNSHHVNHQKDSAEKTAAKDGDAEAQKAADELAKEIASGKQKTMASFFTKKPAPVKKAAKQEAVNWKPAAPKETKKDSPKNQKQSLILLDEVDILYDEDKQFWAKVIELIVKSKRPFIMTCNDETLVPLHALNLYGIFRLSPPPTDLAVDRLLLIAANEGHALQREPVEALYVARNHDLRAATTELNYWCQMGVGDRRGGFDWFYPRWPKGIDLDDNKEVVRVVSEDAYQLGMGWLGRDVVVDKQTDIEEEILQQTWHLWDLDAGCWQDSPEFAGWVDNVTRATSERSARAAALEMYDVFAESMSAADICSSGSFAQLNEELIDATTTDLCSRSADDYILGLPMLDAPSVLRHNGMFTTLPIAIKSMARQVLESTTALLLPRHPPTLPSLDEEKATAMICHHFSAPPVDALTISRIDFSLAFDPIAASDKTLSSSASYLDPSVLDRNLEPITLDVAPYVRAIVAYDANLQQQRLRLSNLVSEGGSRKGLKRMRTTRAAYSAMEGGSRKTTRADRWFKAELNSYLVMRTGGKGWTELVVENGIVDGGSATTPSPKKEAGSPGSATVDESPSPKAVRKTKGRPRKVIKEDSEDELA